MALSMVALFGVEGKEDSQRSKIERLLIANSPEDFCVFIMLY